jgi:hypothetical protein
MLNCFSSNPKVDFKRSFRKIRLTSRLAFNVPANQYGGMQQRLGFNITKFIADQKLEAPLAANWLQVPSGSS